MSAETELQKVAAARIREGTFFRPFIGVLCVLGSLLGFGALYIVAIPPENKDAMMFALGIVFGWGGSVVSSEYGATTTGRKVAESAIRNIERQETVAQDVNVVNTEDGAIPVTETKK